MATNPATTSVDPLDRQRRTPPRTRRRAAPTILAGVALAALLTACGRSTVSTSWGPAGSGVSGHLTPAKSSSKPPTTSTPDPAPSTSGTAMMPVEPKPGVAGVSVAYSDPAVDPCAVATSLLEAIAKVVP